MCLEVDLTLNCAPVQSGPVVAFWLWSGGVGATEGLCCSVGVSRGGSCPGKAPAGSVDLQSEKRIRDLRLAFTQVEWRPWGFGRRQSFRLPDCAVDP
jgi:hypothetical protein